MIVEDADLEAIEQRDTSRSIDINRFVRLEEVDPIYFDRTYSSSLRAPRRSGVRMSCCSRR